MPFSDILSNMNKLESETFALENFEGPLEFLLHLIQKNEIEIYDVQIRKITEQYLQRLEEQLDPDIETGAEIIGTTAWLLWLKSKTLLPKHEQVVSEEELEQDPRFEILHHLIDYCRFKEAAKELTSLEAKQNAYFRRGCMEISGLKKNLGIEHLTLEEITVLFSQIAQKASSQKGAIVEETWRVADKIHDLKDLMQKNAPVPLDVLFSENKCREELIVIFLAILELMKSGLISVIKDLSNETISLTTQI